MPTAEPVLNEEYARVPSECKKYRIDATGWNGKPTYWPVKKPCWSMG